MGGLAAWLMQLHVQFFGIELNLGDIAGSLQSLISFTQIQSLSLSGSLAGNLTGAATIPGILFFVSQSFKTIATQILFIFTIIKMISLAMNIERVSWNQIVMQIIRFFLFKFLIDFSTDFFSLIFEIGDGLMSQLSSFFGAIQSSPNVWSDIAKDIDEASWGWSLFGINLGPLLAFITFLLFYLPLMGTYIALIAQVFFRVFKIIGIICFAPIPIAVTAFDEGAGSRRFLLTGISAVLEGLFIILSVNIYSLAVSSLQILGESQEFSFLAHMLGIMILNAVLAMAISQASSLVSQWIGG